MEGDLGWCCGGGGSSSSNNWDLHAVVRSACGGGAGQDAPPSDDSFPWLSSLQPQLQLPTEDDVPTVHDLCQAILPEPKQAPEEAPHQLSSPRNETQRLTPADEAPAKPQPSGRGGGGPTRSKRKYVMSSRVS
jgi:WRKY transcription factor 22